MKILILTIGTRGDVQPYVALGHALVAAGHAVTLCTSIRFEAFVTQNGLAFAPIGDDLVALLDSVQRRGALEDMGSFVSGLKTALKLVRQVDHVQRALVEEAWLVARRRKSASWSRFRMTGYSHALQPSFTTGAPEQRPKACEQ